MRSSGGREARFLKWLREAFRQTSPVVAAFNNAGVPVWGEIELAYNYEKGVVAAITGTNGKTTTTTLVGEIIKAWGKETFVSFLR